MGNENDKINPDDWTLVELVKYTYRKLDSVQRELHDLKSQVIDDTSKRIEQLERDVHEIKTESRVRDEEQMKRHRTTRIIVAIVGISLTVLAYLRDIYS